MDYQFLSARIASFSSPKSKRSKASSSKQSSSSYIKWPHPASYKATPESLAEAGFYYNPSASTPDCTTCYMCKKSIEGWEPDDDPFAIHYEKCQDRCAWAVVRCQAAMGEKSYRYTDPARHPLSKTMQKARQDTFSLSRWPHDAVKGHGANSKALAKAGFVCNSESTGDDTAVCLYCKLSLGGWDEEDDPYEEHVKRKDKKCAFLKAYTEDSLLAPSTSIPSTSKSSSKASRAEKSVIPDDSDDELAISSELSPPPKTSSTRASRGGSARSSSVPVKTPASRRSARSTGKTPGSRTVSSEVEETDGASESDTGKRGGKTKRKTGGRPKTRVSAIAEEDNEDELHVSGPPQDEEVVATIPESQPTEKKKRGRPPKSSTAKPASKSEGKKTLNKDEPLGGGEDSDAVSLPPAKKSHTRSRSKANLESEAAAAPATSKPATTRTKSGSKAKAKHDVDDDIAPASKKKGKQAAREQSGDEDVVSAPPARPKGKAVTRAVSKVPDDGALTQDDDAPSHKRVRGEPDKKSRTRPPSTERKSSLSEDAGYATAEPLVEADRMEVDEEPAALPPHTNTKAKKPSSSTAHRTLAGAAAAGKRSSPLDDNARTESTVRSAATRLSNQSKKDSLQVIEIDSDGEESGSQEARPKSRTKGKTAPARSVSSSKNKPKKPASPTSKETTVSAGQAAASPPVPEPEDELMTETSPARPERAQPTSLPKHKSHLADPSPFSPGTPISAVHRSAMPSPVHEQTGGDDVDMVGSGPGFESSVASTSEEPPKPRQTYHPFLAQIPVEELAKLSEAEAEMTVEQYIRQEMEAQYVQFKADAERRIEEFKQKAAEARRVIEMS